MVELLRSMRTLLMALLLTRFSSSIGKLYLKYFFAYKFGYYLYVLLVYFFAGVVLNDLE
jgi:hypothetical protein